MTEHSRHLVETIARVLYRHRMATVDTIDGWTDWGDLPESWRCEWRDAAEAALDALPQPLGYGIHIESAGTQWLDENTFATKQEAVREATRGGFDPYDERDTTVVALIPVEPDHA